MILGAHMSIAGGISEAIKRGTTAGCDAIQIFTKSNKQWKAKPLKEDEVKLFLEAKNESGISVVFGHNCYLINLASPDEEMHKKSVEAMIVELERCEKLELPWLVMHPGAHKGTGEEAGLKRIAKSLDNILKATEGFNTRIALENTAGAGSVLGFRFEHLSKIIDMSKEPERLVVCFDTCHAFAAGYDISEKSGYGETMNEFDQLIGLDKLVCFHLNDAMKDLGSRVDRHEHIGSGKIGLEGFSFLINDRRFRNLPMVLETPKDKDMTEDKINLKTLRSLIRTKKK